MPKPPTARITATLNRALTQAELDSIEEIIDACGTHNVCCAIAEIADLKAEHVMCHWSDKPLANLWARQSRAFYTFAANLCKRFPSTVT